MFFGHLISDVDNSALMVFFAAMAMVADNTDGDIVVIHVEPLNNISMMSSTVFVVI